MQGLLYKCLLLIIMQKTNISSNNSPKISIIVPVYNGMKYFPLNIDSAISDNPNIETIIVDDGSTDGSSTYLDNCYANNRNVNVYHKNNGGIVSARNYGLARATGDYLFFLDQDDHFSPEVLNIAARKCCDFGCDIAFFTTKTESDGITSYCDKIKKDAIVGQDEIKETIIPSVALKTENDYAVSMCHLWGAVFRRSVIKDSGIIFKNFVGYEDDYLFLIDALLESKKICFVTRTGYYWTRDHYSTSFSLKYVSDIWDKFIALYSYVFSKCSQYNVSLPEEMKTFVYQSISIHSLENCASIINPNIKEDMKIIRMKLRSKDVQLAFQKDSVRNYSGRSRRLFTLLSKKKYFTAECYSYIDSIYQYLKYKLKR